MAKKNTFKVDQHFKNFRHEVALYVNENCTGNTTGNKPLYTIKATL